MIKRNTKKRAAQNRLYLKLRAKFLAENELCKVGYNGCSIAASEIHHKIGRIGSRLTDVENFLPVCRNCHEAIEWDPQMAISNGFSKSKLAK